MYIECIDCNKQLIVSSEQSDQLRGSNLGTSPQLECLPAIPLAQTLPDGRQAGWSIGVMGLTQWLLNIDY